jgi:hypothetical protein
MVSQRCNAPFRRADEFQRRSVVRIAVAAALAGGMLAATCAVEAHTTNIQILTRTTAFGGHSFPGVGQYEVITGIATGEIDPADPRNGVITDLQLAPRNANGTVGYRHNFYILRPIDGGNHQMMYEPPNRGGKTYTSLNRTPVSAPFVNDPASITDPAILANSFLWARGYTTVWSGWENALANLNTSPNTTTATAELPVAHNAGGSTIMGPAYDYIVSPGATYALTYAAASGTKSPDAVLTHRIHLDDSPVTMADTDWDYTDATHKAIKVNTPGGFVPNDIYEFSYVARDPTVNGVGFAAVRDFNSFLRYSTDASNPLAGQINRIYTEISSQPGRLLNDFTDLGFNEDESGRKVFDGLMQWIAAGDGINMNYRWSQTKRTNRNRQDLLYLEGRFPFANVMTHDPLTGKTDSRYARCEQTSTCPLAVEIYSANEYWVKGASLLHTDPTGTVDLPDSPYARNYFIASHQHGTGNAASRGACQQFQNPLNSAPIQRALFLALDAWSNGVAPPASEVPKLSDGTLIPPPAPRADHLYVGIPGVTYTGLKTTRYLFDYGPNFDATGIPTINPPVITPPYEDNPGNGKIYPTYVPKTDSDGNDIAGVHLPDVTVPLATYTGWALRSGVWANDGCEGSGQYIPFTKTAADRAAAGDPRPSIEERYKSFGQYRSGVVNAVDSLVKNRLMLCEDADDQVHRLIDAGLAAGVPTPNGNEPKYPAVPHCN